LPAPGSCARLQLALRRGSGPDGVAGVGSAGVGTVLVEAADSACAPCVRALSGSAKCARPAVMAAPTKPAACTCESVRTALLSSSAAGDSAGRGAMLMRHTAHALFTSFDWNR